MCGVGRFCQVYVYAVLGIKERDDNGIRRNSYNDYLRKYEVSKHVVCLYSWIANHVPMRGSSMQ